MIDNVIVKSNAGEIQISVPLALGFGCDRYHQIYRNT